MSSDTPVGYLPTKYTYLIEIPCCFMSVPEAKQVPIAQPISMTIQMPIDVQKLSSGNLIKGSGPLSPGIVVSAEQLEFQPEGPRSVILKRAYPNGSYKQYELLNKLHYIE